MSRVTQQKINKKRPRMNNVIGSLNPENISKKSKEFDTLNGERVRKYPSNEKEKKFAIAERVIFHDPKMWHFKLHKS